MSEGDSQNKVMTVQCFELTQCGLHAIHSTITTTLTLLQCCDLETKVTRVHFTRVSVLASRLKISGVGLETKGPRYWSSLWQGLGLRLKTKEPRSRSRDQIPKVLVSRPGLEFWKTSWQQPHFCRSSTVTCSPRLQHSRNWQTTQFRLQYISLPQCLTTPLSKPTTKLTEILGLTLWRPLLLYYGYSYKASCARQG